VAMERLSAILPKMSLVTQGDKLERREVKKYLEDFAVGILEGILCIMQCISRTTINVSDICLNINLCMLKSCNARREAKQSHCLVFQEICQLHRLL
jgi:hypothetical protein